MLVFNLTSTNEIRINQSTVLDRCISEMADGSSAAMTDLYNLTCTAVYSFAFSILKNSQDAEDVLHDCYISVYSAAPTYQSTGKPMAWIITIARNFCLLKLREHKKISDLPVEDWESHFHQKEEISQEDRLVLIQCMTQLTDVERQVVILHAVAGFKHREIAEIMDLSLTAVLSKYHRALKKLKKSFEEDKKEGKY